MIQATITFCYKKKYLRAFITFVRMIYFVKIKNRMTTLSKDLKFVSKKTLRSNKRRVVADSSLPDHPSAKYLFGLDLDVVGGKSQRFLDFLKAFYNRIEREKVLIIGPRNEAELFTFAANGIPIGNISSIDLFSYSPKISLMDMHSMDFGDEVFDVVYAGWVISYSENRDTAISEMLRVLKPGGVIGLTATFSKTSNDELIKNRGYMVGSKNRIKSIDCLAKLFNDLENDGRIVFQSTRKDFKRNSAGMICFEKNF
jgi:SAM-dependent methyltransferase